MYGVDMRNNTLALYPSATPSPLPPRQTAHAHNCAARTTKKAGTVKKMNEIFSSLEKATPKN
jgi:hypothetical protein